MTDQPDVNPTLTTERWKLLITLDHFLDKPLIVLSLVWIFLFILEINFPSNKVIAGGLLAVWGIFVLDFVMGFIIAPDRKKYLKKNWLSGISVLLPAVGVLRIYRLARFMYLVRMSRPLNLVRLLISVRRGVNTLRIISRRHGLGYVTMVTIFVTFAGAAGMAYFESPQAVSLFSAQKGHGIATYWDALWWTSMMITTIGSDYWPRTPEGRFLSWLLALYGFTFISYITANFASHFITQNKSSSK